MYNVDFWTILSVEAWPVIKNGKGDFSEGGGGQSLAGLESRRLDDEGDAKAQNAHDGEGRCGRRVGGGCRWRAVLPLVDLDMGSAQ